MVSQVCYCPDKEGTPERSEGAEVIQLKYFLIRGIIGV